MKPVTVLITEDEAITAFFMERKLRQKGYNVLKPVSSGDEAVESAIKHRPDIVLMDIRLAGKMDGIEAAEKIKGEPGLDIQFIFMSGYSEYEIKKQNIKLESLAFITKPVNLPELFNIIDSYIEKRDI